MIFSLTVTQVKSGGHEEVAEASKSDIKDPSLTGLFNKGTLLLVCFMYAM